ncbi:hypothetical protein MKX01_025591 [Papaver californicum]|nr:hypothetical protein MKX01_025591 [Papaver californicum]
MAIDSIESPSSPSPPPSYFSQPHHFYLAVDRVQFKMEHWWICWELQGDDHPYQWCFVAALVMNSTLFVHLSIIFLTFPWPLWRVTYFGTSVNKLRVAHKEGNIFEAHVDLFGIRWNHDQHGCGW